MNWMQHGLQHVLTTGFPNSSASTWSAPSSISHPMVTKPTTFPDPMSHHNLAPCTPPPNLFFPPTLHLDSCFQTLLMLKLWTSLWYARRLIWYFKCYPTTWILECSSLGMPFHFSRKSITFKDTILPCAQRHCNSVFT